MKIKLIQDKTFHTYCRLFYDCTEIEFLNYANKKNGTNYQPTEAIGKFIYQDEKDFLNVFIWIDKKNNYETLAHEILHMIRFWLQDCRYISLSEETDEVYTLLHSFYFRECIKALNK